jgi:high affinity Mn2+ porin
MKKNLPATWHAVITANGKKRVEMRWRVAADFRDIKAGAAAAREVSLVQHPARRRAAALMLCLFATIAPPLARADEAAAPEDWSAHFQLTGIYQGYPAFHATFQGPNSLPSNSQFRETLSGTAFLGARLPWQVGELYFDPEFNQGFGLGHTLGIEGFPNGEAQKAGFDTPKPNVARLFLRHTIGLGGDSETLDPGPNQLGETVDVSRVTITTGKMAVPDIFDTNQYAHDPRADFMNWSVWESAAWDYPADEKGYTDGVAVELNQKDWALRGGWFLEPKIANQRNLDPRFLKRYGTVVELETRHELWGAPGKVHWLLFANRAPQANLDQVDAAALATGTTPNPLPFRRDSWKVGAALDLEQSITKQLGFFARLSWNDGRTEGWAFTDIDRSLAIGPSLKGASWGRPDDTVALAAVMNGLSKPARNYLAAGGLGILGGDGKLSYSPEEIVETYYSFALAAWGALTVDYQFVANPAFDTARGPVSIFATRVHIAF